MFSHRGRQQGRNGGAMQTQLWGIGNGANGGLGNNSTVSRSSPVQVGSLGEWIAFSSGASNGAGIRKDGSLWTWGRGFYAASGGQGNIIPRSSPTIVGNEGNWRAVWTTKDWQYAASSTFAIKNDGTFWSWGMNMSGELGINVAGGATVGRSSPVQIGSDADWQMGTSGRYNAFALKKDGSIWAWGIGTSGTLGINSTVNRSSPVQIGSQLDWVQIAAGMEHVLALKNDGTLWSWGTGSAGATGRSSTVNISSPAQIGSDTSWVTIAAGLHASFAIKSDGTLWAWGDAGFGALGRNNATDISSPAQVGSDTNWQKVSAGLYITAAIKNDGTLWTWGRNNNSGALGNNTIVSRSSPAQVGSDKGWIDVSANIMMLHASKIT